MVMAEINQLQPGLVQQFQNVIQHDRLSQAYVFVGPRGSGPSALATWLAQRLFCTNLQDGQPCGECDECRRVLTGNHTDVLTISPEGTAIKADAVRGLKEEMSKSGMEGNRRVFIIEDADRMTTAAANSLLKFFEEPYPGMLIILTTTNKNGLLPTVLSRAQVIQFPAPRRGDIEDQLVAANVAPSLANVVARLTASVDGGVELAQDEDFAKRVHVMLQLVDRLAAGDELAFPLIQTDVVKACPDRATQRQFVQLLALAYSEAINRCYGAAPAVFKQDEGVAHLAQRAGTHVANGLQLVLSAGTQIESNVNFQANMEQLVLLILRG